MASSLYTDPTGSCKLRLGRVGASASGSTLLGSSGSTTMRVGDIYLKVWVSWRTGSIRMTKSDFWWWQVYWREKMRLSSFESMSERREGRLNEGNIVKRTGEL